MPKETRWRGAGKPQSVVKLTDDVAREARILLLARRGWQSNATITDIVNEAIHALYLKYDESIERAAREALAGE